MRKIAWIAAIAESRETPGTYCAYGIPIQEGTNILALLKQHPDLTQAELCTTKKECRRLVDYWNQCFRDNGTHTYYGNGNPLF